MISKPLTSSQVKELPNGYGYAPAYMNRSERRKLERKNPRIKKLYESMAKNQTLDVNKALEKDKIKTIVSESLSEVMEQVKDVPQSNDNK